MVEQAKSAQGATQSSRLLCSFLSSSPRELSSCPWATQGWVGCLKTRQAATPANWQQQCASTGRGRRGRSWASAEWGCTQGPDLSGFLSEMLPASSRPSLGTTRRQVKGIIKLCTVCNSKAPLSPYFFSLILLARPRRGQFLVENRREVNTFLTRNHPEIHR